MLKSLDELAGVKGITFGSLNIRGLLKSVDELTVFLKQMKVDVLLVQETLLSDSIDSALLAIPDYNLYRFDRQSTSGKRGGGGLAVYTHK